MFDIWIGEVDSTTLFVIAAVLFVLPLQPLLCFKAKKLLVKLLPSIFLIAAVIFFFAMMFVAQDWDAVGYAILGALSGALLVISGIAWAIWAIVIGARKRKGGVK